MDRSDDSKLAFRSIEASGLQTPDEVALRVSKTFLDHVYMLPVKT